MSKQVLMLPRQDKRLQNRRSHIGIWYIDLPLQSMGPEFEADPLNSLRIYGNKESLVETTKINM